MGRKTPPKKATLSASRTFFGISVLVTAACAAYPRMWLLLVSWVVMMLGYLTLHTGVTKDNF